VTVLTPAEARLLDSLSVAATSASAVASAAGLRRARARGAGAEFQEHRPYQPGDDPRAIDWSVEARLDQLVVRVARSDGELRVHLLVDVSQSMTLGAPAKLICAAKIAAAVSYVAVERRDLVGLATFDHRVDEFLPAAAGRPQLFRVLDLLRSVSARGASETDDALLQFGAAVRGPGLAIVISDFCEPGSGMDGLRFLLHRGLIPAVVQVVTSDELAPRVQDSVELVDVENPSRTIVVTPDMVDSYRRRLTHHHERLRQFCAGESLPWLQINASTPFAAMVAQLQRTGIFSLGA
jgi:uncharacterized protein (DUF58 family)